ncbi:MAG: hypothetical protein ABW000_13500 [Actinoplanes sp.]
MSDMRPEQEPDRDRAVTDPADEPTTGPPAGASTAPPQADASAAPSPGPEAAAGHGDPGDGREAGIDAVTSSGTGHDHDLGAGAGASAAGPEPDLKARRRRRLFIGGIVAGAALIVIALCGGGLAVIAAVSGFRDGAADAREGRQLRDSACIALETRLNRLTPPGATLTPQARAVAVRDENAAARIYVTQGGGGERTADNWRQLIDARAAFADALDAQAKTRTPAFYVAPAAGDGRAVTDQLARQSPAACAGAIRRLAAPDL